MKLKRFYKSSRVESSNDEWSMCVSMDRNAVSCRFWMSMESTCYQMCSTKPKRVKWTRILRLKWPCVVVNCKNVATYEENVTNNENQACKLKSAFCQTTATHVAQSSTVFFYGLACISRKPWLAVEPDDTNDANFSNGILHMAFCTQFSFNSYRIWTTTVFEWNVSLMLTHTKTRATST